MIIPSMVSKGEIPLVVIPANGSHVLGIYKGKLSEIYILTKGNVLKKHP